MNISHSSQNEKNMQGLQINIKIFLTAGKPCSPCGGEGWWDSIQTIQVRSSHQLVPVIKHKTLKINIQMFTRLSENGHALFSCDGEGMSIFILPFVNKNEQ